MNIKDLLLPEFEKECESTGKMLECVPEGKNDWKPHEKSMTLGRLASHVAEIPHWASWIMDANEFDMLATPFERRVCADHAELMAYFEEKKALGLKSLQNATNEQLMEMWAFKAGEKVVMQAPRYHAIRSWMFNHQVHHRGQLSVFLRLLDIPIPGLYGPSADDRIRMQQAASDVG